VPAPTVDPLRNFGFLLREVSSLSALNFERYSGDLGLTLAQCKILTYLQRNEGISQVRLAELTDTDPMTLARTLERMEGDGWIERKPDPADRRARRLFLKPTALRLLQNIWRVADRARIDAMSGLSAADRAQLMGLLERVRCNLNTVLRADA
jgi:MarR family transcriptional regulator, transcriptional regulator for hemolysin